MLSKNQWSQEKVADTGRTRFEYGGFLPLELNPGKEYFDGYDSNLMRFNSVKASLDYLIRSLSVSKIYIPFYYCPSTTQSIKDAVKDVFFYHIGSDLLPEEFAAEPEAAVLLVNYFGVLDKRIVSLEERYPDNTVIIDNAHAFFNDPVMKPKVYNVYSAKKIIGVPDGSYIVAGDLVPEKQGESLGTRYAEYLLMAYEQGTNAAYRQKKETDKKLSKEYGPMSRLSKGILQNADYNRIRSARERNFSVLNKGLSGFNELKYDRGFPAYLYPFLVKNGKKIKEKLVEDRIFVSTLWSGEDLLINGNEFELHMSEDAVFLPIDQRYDDSDIRYIMGRVAELIKENR